MKGRYFALVLLVPLAYGGCEFITAPDRDLIPKPGAGGSAGAAAGGMGGAACVPEDCPGESTDCSFPDCIDGECGVTNAAAGATCDGDGNAEVCDGMGTCVECTEDEHCDDADLPLCRDFTCVACEVDPDACGGAGGTGGGGMGGAGGTGGGGMGGAGGMAGGGGTAGSGG